MIHIGSVRDWAIVTSVKSWITSKRVSCLLSAAALVATGWDTARAEDIIGSLGSVTMTDRIFVNDVGSICAAVKAFPGNFEFGVPIRYKTHSFTNNGPHGCVTFKMVSDPAPFVGGPCAFLSIYSGGFNPDNRAENYLGDQGEIRNGKEMGVFLLFGQTVTLVVSSLEPQVTCAYKIMADITPAAHDFGATGSSDIVWRQTSTGAVALWHMDGSSVLSTNSFVTAAGPVPVNWQIVGQRDFNGNGRSDLLWRDTTSGAVAVWSFNLGGNFAPLGLGTVPTTWSIVGTGDFNGDSRGDILWRDTSTGTVAVWLMNGATVLSSNTTGAVPGNWVIAGAGDFDGDGKTDILWRNTSTGQAAIWFMFGTVVFSTAGIGTVPTTWSIVATGDFNGDGMADIVWRDTSGNVAIWLMNGGSVLQSRTLGTVPANWSLVETGDFKADGKAALLWRDTSTGAVAIWFMNGVAISSTAAVATVPTDWVIQNVNAN